MLSFCELIIIRPEFFTENSNIPQIELLTLLIAKLAGRYFKRSIFYDLFGTRVIKMFNIKRENLIFI